MTPHHVFIIAFWLFFSTLFSVHVRNYIQLSIHAWDAMLVPQYKSVNNYNPKWLFCYMVSITYTWPDSWLLANTCMFRHVTEGVDLICAGTETGICREYQDNAMDSKVMTTYAFGYVGCKVLGLPQSLTLINKSPLDKMAAFRRRYFQMRYQRWSLFQMVKWTIFQHWLR